MTLPHPCQRPLPVLRRLLPIGLAAACLVTCCALVGCNSRSIGEIAGRITRSAARGVAARDADDQQCRPSADTADDDRGHLPGAADTVLQQCQQELQQHQDYPFDFDLTTLDGQRLTLRQFAGRVVVVDIWGTWCPPCRGEIPHFVQLHQRYAAAGLAIVGINYERTSNDRQARQAIEAFTHSQPIPYPLALGTEALQDRIPDFRGYPTTLMIDRTGRVRATLVGARSLPYLDTMVRLLLDEPDDHSLGGLAAARSLPPQTAAAETRRASAAADDRPSLPRVQLNPFAVDPPP